MKKYNFLFIVSLLFLWQILVLPVGAAIKNIDAEQQTRCWPQETCVNDYGGIWGKSDEFKKYNKGKEDSFKCMDLGTDGGVATARCFTGSPDLPLQVGIPGVKDKFCSIREKDGSFKSCNTIGQPCGEKNAGVCRPGIAGGFPGYIKEFYKFFIAALAVIAIVMVMWGGFKRIMAAGSPEKVKDANDTIMGAITGVVIALMSYALLNLINPQLVANTMPLIEMVRPQTWGFCPKFDDQYKLLYEQGYVEITGKCVNDNSKLCLSNSDCDGQTCRETNIMYYENPNTTERGNSCGRVFMVDGRQCTGLECYDSSYGCFATGTNTFPKYKCAQFSLRGNLGGLGAENFEYVAMRLICNNTTTLVSHFPNMCNIAVPGSSRGRTINVENNVSYAIDYCGKAESWEIKTREDCTAFGGYKGFALLLEVDCGGSMFECSDDWYAIDASSCSSAVSKKISDGTQTDPFKINWQNIDKEKLFDLVSDSGNITGKTCDLNITRTEFPNR